MSDQDKQEAKELAGRASNQAKNAAKNSGRAVKAVADATADDVVEETRDAAEKLEGTAREAAQAARKLNVGVLGKMSGDTGVAFLATSVSIYAGIVAYSKFRQAFSGGAHVID